MRKEIVTFVSRFSNLMKNHTIPLSVLSICMIPACTSVHAQTQSCFEKVKLEPGLIAFTTNKDSKLANWYKSTFGLSVVKEFSFPDGTVTGVLMQNGEFVVEVFNRDDAFDSREYVDESRREQWLGVMKFGVYTDANLVHLKQCLQDQGVNAGRIFNDKKLGIDLLQVTDPEQNVLEIISRSGG